MKKEKNELLEFLAGMAMFIVGLYILSQRVMVSTSWFSIGGFYLRGGLLFVPLIAGIIWLFATGSRGAKILTTLGGAFVVISVILSVDVHLMSMSLFDWVVLLVLIFGGLGLLCKVLFNNPNPDRPNNYNSTKKDEKSQSVAISVEEELEAMRKGKF